MREVKEEFFMEEEEYMPLDPQAYELEENYKLFKESSMYIKRNDLYLPSIDAVVIKTLPPGVYTIHQGNDLFAKNLPKIEDKLYNFKDSVSEEVLREINDFWSKSSKFKEFDLIHKRGILLEGPPGTGKSSIINLLCEQLVSKGGVVFKLRNERNFESYLDYIKLFKKIEPNRNFITIIEDIDTYDHIKTDLLDLLDGKTQFNGHIVLATTNNSGNLENTFLRPSRFDLRILIGPPSENVKREYLETKGFTKEELDIIIDKISKFTFADLKELFISVKLLGYNLDTAIEKISNPLAKKNYLTNQLGKVRIGI